VVLSELAPEVSRSRLQKLITEGMVKVNGRPVLTPSAKVHPHHLIEAAIPPADAPKIEPEPGPVNILYEDADLLVLNKPAGLAVHPGAGRTSGTLINRLIALPGFRAEICGQLRPGLVHRLDMDTTGVMVVAKSDQAWHGLRRQLDDHSMTRRYVALAWRPFSEPMGTIDAPIGRHPQYRLRMAVRPAAEGRHAVTHYRVLEPYGPISLVECALETGRTHQIRVHLAHIGHVVVNDGLYGGSFERMSELLPQTWRTVRTTLLQAPRQLLHAWRLRFNHPTKNQTMEFDAPMPEDMLRVVESLRESVAKPIG
jgi:23S rRNA pseudouridine1911/1915/1917 synthase